MDVHNIKINLGSDTDSHFNYKIKPGELTFIEYNHDYSHLRVIFKLIASRNEELKNIKGVSNLKHNKTRERFNTINEQNHNINEFISPQNIDNLEKYDLIYFLDIDSLKEYIKNKTDYNNIEEFLKDYYKNDKDYHIIIFSSKSTEDLDFNSKFLYNIFILKSIDKTEEKKSGKINTIMKNTKSLTQSQQPTISFVYSESVEIDITVRLG